MNRHQAVGLTLIFDLNVGERLSGFIDQVQPEAVRILRRLNQHVAVGIALRLRPAGAVGAGGKEKIGLGRRRRGSKGR